jgi:hypothetical protein
MSINSVELTNREGQKAKLSGFTIIEEKVWKYIEIDEQGNKLLPRDIDGRILIANADIKPLSEIIRARYPKLREVYVVQSHGNQKNYEVHLYGQHYEITLTIDKNLLVAWKKPRPDFIPVIEEFYNSAIEHMSNLKKLKSNIHSALTSINKETA